MDHESEMEFDDESEDELVLERAIHTRLPKGSMSPDKGRSVSPERQEDRTVQVNGVQPMNLSTDFMRDPSTENCKLPSHTRISLASSTTVNLT